MGCLVEKEENLRGREWIETNADGMGGTIPGRWKGEGGGVDRKRLFRAVYLAGTLKDGRDDVNGAAVLLMI